MSEEEFVRETDIRPQMLRLTRDSDQADDLCQSVWLKCWSDFQKTGIIPCFAYVVSIGRNKYFNDERGRKRRRQVSADNFDRDGREADPATTLENKELGRILQAALNALPLNYREVVQLHILDGWTFPAIAQAMDLSVNTVKLRFYRAIPYLKRKLEYHGIRG